MPSTHFYSVNTVQLNEEGTSTVEVLRAGIIRDRGLKITKEMLIDFVRHFKENVYGTELQVNFGHNREGEAGGWIKELFIDPSDDNRLMSRIDWTPLGIEKLKNKLYKFVSAEFADRFPDYQTGEIKKNVFSGLALTNVPALKGQYPIALSEDIHLTNFNYTMFKTFITKLNERAFISKEDKELAQSLFAELSEEEQAEQKPEMEAVEAKPEVDEAKVAEEAAAKAAAEKAEAEKAEAERVAAEEAAKVVPATEALSEQFVKVNKLAEEQAMKIKELSEILAKKDLSESFESTYMLSESRKVGFQKESKEAVVSFLMELSEAQREAFKNVISEMRSVDLSVRGSTDAVSLSGDMESKIVALSEQLLKEGKAKNITEAQKMATAELK